LDVDFASGSDEATLGGDWYDAFWLPDGRIALSIGDVMGRGIRAAGFMGLVRQTIRAGAYDRDNAADILSRTNQLLRLGDPADTASALVAIVDPNASSLTYASAGHPAPLVATPDGRVASGPPGGPPLGLARLGEQYDNFTLPLSPGALAVLYTDGLTEYKRDPVSGELELREALRDECRQPTSKPAESIRRRVMGDIERHDDVALVTLGVAPTPLMGVDVTFPAIPASLPVIRQAVGRFLAACGVESDRAGALQVAVGEAANNVIEHAYGALRGTLTVRAKRMDPDIVVEVADHGAWRRSRIDSGGRGLQIMRGLVDKVDIASTPDGTTVTLVLSTHGHAPIGESRPAPQ
jgi:anti-sigma regulatory factor (Ser/Thr protein kinase)